MAGVASIRDSGPTSNPPRAAHGPASMRGHPPGGLTSRPSARSRSARLSTRGARCSMSRQRDGRGPPAPGGAPPSRAGPEPAAIAALGTSHRSEATWARPLEDAVLVEAAAAYLDQRQSGSSRPVPDAATAMEMSEARMRDLIYRARRRRLLTEAHQGRGGGILLRRLTQAGLRIFSHLSDTEIKRGTAPEKFQSNAIAFVDEMYREQGRQRTRDAMVSKARRGHVAGGSVYGYRNVPVMQGDRRSHIERVVVADEAAVIRRLFELTAAGTGYQRIAHRLNEEGVLAPEPRRRGAVPSQRVRPVRCLRRWHVHSYERPALRQRSSTSERRGRRHARRLGCPTDSSTTFGGRPSGTWCGPASGRVWP
jgi:DNA invertase Pin-like site-specific DNA recombinase